MANSKAELKMLQRQWREILKAGEMLVRMQADVEKRIEKIVSKQKRK